MKKERRIIKIINAAIFILLEFAAISLLNKNDRLEDIWISQISKSFSASISNGVDNFISYFSLKEENRKLAEENERLSNTLISFHQDELINDEKSSIYKSDDEQFRFIPASVVKLGANTAHNYLVLNKGSEDGVKPQTGIISSKGVAGIVTSVSSHYSYGISFLNSNLKVSCRIGKDQIHALLTWDGLSKNKAFLNDIPAHTIINPGDTVRTSGLSTLFPADIPIGVAASSKMIDGTSIQVIVDLFQDFESLRYVTIADFKDSDVITNLELQNR